MNLEQMLARAQEIENAIINMTSQLNALHGHKTEVAHWITQLQAPQEPAANETQVESSSEPVIE
jgi:hypothetical protein